MASGKKSFITYCDWKEAFDALPNEKAGELIKHMFAYVADENPETDDLLINAVFATFKNTLKRDLKKWEIRAERSRINGSKGGRPKNPEKPSGLSMNPDEPRKPDSVSVSVNVSDSDNETVKKSNTSVLPKKDKSLIERIEDFKNLVVETFPNDPPELIDRFTSYWTEHNAGARKFRREMETIWEITRRMATFRRNFKPTQDTNGEILTTEKALQIVKANENQS